MRTRLAIRAHSWLERYFPERRLFLKSDSDTRFIRLRPETQFLAFMGSAMVVAWAIVATAILLMDSIGSGNFRQQARRDHATYQERLDVLATQRDNRAEEALAARQRFSAALVQISVMQSELLASETHRRELETGIGVIQSTLRTAMKDRDAARGAADTLRAQAAGDDIVATAATPLELNFLADALERTAGQRDRVVADAQDALKRADDLDLEIKLMREQNDQIFRQLEEAMTISVEPLNKMFRAAGMPPERILEQIRRGYSGQGGPLTPLSFSTRGTPPTADEIRANRLLDEMDRLNLYRIAAERAPFAVPVKAAYRLSSRFGYRRDPKTGGRRMHNGNDMAAPTGTPVYATADGVVSYAGWMSGFGRIVKIKHDFGIETFYAHNSRLRVKTGQRVSRGDRIADIGSSGRSTGPHLHYEIRVNGKPVNPMIYIEAAKNVF